MTDLGGVGPSDAAHAGQGSRIGRPAVDSLQARARGAAFGWQRKSRSFGPNPRRERVRAATTRPLWASCSSPGTGQSNRPLSLPVLRQRLPTVSLAGMRSNPSRSAIPSRHGQSCAWIFATLFVDGLSCSTLRRRRSWTRIGRGDTCRTSLSALERSRPGSPRRVRQPVSTARFCRAGGSSVVRDHRPPAARPHGGPRYGRLTAAGGPSKCRAEEVSSPPAGRAVAK